MKKVVITLMYNSQCNTSIYQSSSLSLHNTHSLLTVTLLREPSLPMTIFNPVPAFIFILSSYIFQYPVLLFTGWFSHTDILLGVLTSANISIQHTILHINPWLRVYNHATSKYNKKSSFTYHISRGGMNQDRSSDTQHNDISTSRENCCLKLKQNIF